MLADMMRWGTESGQQLPNERFFEGNHPMMWAGGGFGAFWVFGILCIVTWILVIVVLIALARWLWFKGDKERKR